MISFKRIYTVYQIIQFLHHRESWCRQTDVMACVGAHRATTQMPTKDGPTKAWLFFDPSPARNSGRRERARVSAPTWRPRAAAILHVPASNFRVPRPRRTNVWRRTHHRASPRPRTLPLPSPREQSGRGSRGSETPLINTSLSAAPLHTPKPPLHASIVLVDFLAAMAVVTTERTLVPAGRLVAMVKDAALRSMEQREDGGDNDDDDDDDNDVAPAAWWHRVKKESILCTLSAGVCSLWASLECEDSVVRSWDPMSRSIWFLWYDWD